MITLTDEQAAMVGRLIREHRSCVHPGDRAMRGEVDEALALLTPAQPSAHASGEASLYELALRAMYLLDHPHFAGQGADPGGWDRQAEEVARGIGRHVIARRKAEQEGNPPPAPPATCGHAELLRDIAHNGFDRCGRHEMGEVDPLQCRRQEYGLCDAHRIEAAMSEADAGEWEITEHEVRAMEPNGIVAIWKGKPPGPLRAGDRIVRYRRAKGGAM